MTLPFLDRRDAGKQLASSLERFRGDPDCVVIALPRGGVEVGYEVAKELCLLMDVVVPRKVGAPGHEELAVGAVTEDGTFLLNERVLSQLGLSKESVRDTIEEERKEAVRRIQLYRGGRPPADFAGKTLLVVDDGIATGSTMHAALASLSKQNADRIIVAVPVAPPETMKRLKGEADEVICLELPFDFHAVGQFFARFDQTPDETVIALLSAIHEER